MKLGVGCKACGGSGVMEGDPTAPEGSVRLLDVPCPECSLDNLAEFTKKMIAKKFHPNKSPDCSGEIEVSPHVYFMTCCYAWRCVHCMVYGKLLSDGTMTLEGPLTRVTKEDIRATIEGAIVKHLTR